jgi:hypothetical protein
MGDQDLLVVGPGVLGSRAGVLWKEAHPTATVMAQTNSDSNHKRYHLHLLQTPFNCIKNELCTCRAQLLFSFLSRKNQRVIFFMKKKASKQFFLYRVHV